MSAVTIRDMARIVQNHGLVPVPLDVDMDTLAVHPNTVRNAITPRTRAIVVAHLFGSRMPMDGLLAVARTHRLLVVEDCAQAFTGNAFRGHPESDVVMFSFGTIKTNSALGGALLHVKDTHLRRRMRAHEAGWKLASRSWYLARLLKYALLKLVVRPSGFALLYAACRLLGFEHEQLINESVRGFAGPRFFERISHRPPTPLLRVLCRRLRTFDTRELGDRVEAANAAFLALRSVPRPGTRAEDHTHWVAPVLAQDPDGLVRHLWRHGFDATRGSSSLTVLRMPAGYPGPGPVHASSCMRRLLYLPIGPDLDRPGVERLAVAIRSFPDEWTSRRRGTLGAHDAREPEPVP